MAVVHAPTFDEVYEFLLSSPTPAEVIAFRPSEETQERIKTLLDTNRTGKLTEAQQHELDEFAQVEHFVRMLKIKAHQKLKQA
jgi:hypothetical protein